MSEPPSTVACTLAKCREKRAGPAPCKDGGQVGASLLLFPVWARLALPEELAVQIPWLFTLHLHQTSHLPMQSRCCGPCCLAAMTLTLMKHCSMLPADCESSLPLGARVVDGPTFRSCPCCTSYRRSRGNCPRMWLPVLRYLLYKSRNHYGGFLEEKPRLRGMGDTGTTLSWPETLGKLFAPQSGFYSRCHAIRKSCATSLRPAAHPLWSSASRSLTAVCA